MKIADAAADHLDGFGARAVVPACRGLVADAFQACALGWTCGQLSFADENLEEIRRSRKPAQALARIRHFDGYRYISAECTGCAALGEPGAAVAAAAW